MPPTAACTPASKWARLPALSPYSSCRHDGPGPSSRQPPACNPTCAACAPSSADCTAPPAPAGGTTRRLRPWLRPSGCTRPSTTTLTRTTPSHTMTSWHSSLCLERMLLLRRRRRRRLGATGPARAVRRRMPLRRQCRPPPMIHCRSWCSGQWPAAARGCGACSPASLHGSSRAGRLHTASHQRQLQSVRSLQRQRHRQRPKRRQAAGVTAER